MLSLLGIGRLHLNSTVSMQTQIPIITDVLFVLFSSQPLIRTYARTELFSNTMKHIRAETIPLIHHLFRCCLHSFFLYSCVLY